MAHKIMRHFLFLSILMAFLTGSAAAHDTDSPHNHDLAGDAASVSINALTPVALDAHATPAKGVPMAFLIIPIGGESFPFHWFWHTMRGETVDNRIHLAHELMGWYDIPRFHQPDALKDECDRSVSPPQNE